MKNITVSIPFETATAIIAALQIQASLHKFDASGLRMLGDGIYDAVQADKFEALASACLQTASDIQTQWNRIEAETCHENKVAYERELARLASEGAQKVEGPVTFEFNQPVTVAL